MVLLIDTDRREIKVLHSKEMPDEDSVLEAVDELSYLWPEYKIIFDSKKHTMTYPVDFDEEFTNSTISDE